MNAKARRSDRPVPRPVDVVDGIPDRASGPARRRYLLLAALLALWLAVLVYVAYSH